MHGFHKDSVTRRNAPHLTAPQFRRHAAGTWGKLKHGSNWLRNVTDFLRRLRRTKNACGALRCVATLTL